MPEWAKATLKDLSDDKVIFVEEEADEKQVTRSGFKLKDTGAWHIYLRRVDGEREEFSETMMSNGEMGGNSRIFYWTGCMETYGFYQGELVVLSK